jgi:hypothetical protein
MVDPQQLSPTLQQVVFRVLALRAMTKESGFITNRTQRELLNSLNAHDLAEVAFALEAATVTT